MSTESKTEPKETPTLVVAGVKFSAANIVSAVLKIDGREIVINKKDDEPKRLGF